MTTVDRYPLVQGNNAFACNLYHAIKDGQHNIIFSPYSISQALAMVYLGARGETERQMADTLRFSLPQEKLHCAFGALHEHLNPPPPSPSVSEPDLPVRLFSTFNTELTIANAIWGQDGYPFRDGYLNQLDQYYQSEVHRADFKNAADEARRTINTWISEATKGRIQDLLGPGAISPLARLILATAVYFKAGWMHLFDEDLTQEAAFTRLDGSEVVVEMMHLSSERFAYMTGENYQAIQLYYQDNRLAMLVVLPDSGAFEAVEAALDMDLFDKVTSDPQYPDINLSFPRFEAETTLKLAKTLAGMGLTDVFRASADFSGMVDLVEADEPLMINGVIHRANITVDEKGTEAAAAALMAFAGGAFGVPDEPIDFIVDRPFLYFIYDPRNRAILFMGRVLDPTGN